MVYQFLTELEQPLVSSTLARDLLDAFGIDDCPTRTRVYHSLIYRTMDLGRRGSMIAHAHTHTQTNGLAHKTTNY